jgi:hypothetical protein
MAPRNTLWKISIDLKPESVYPLPNDTIDRARLEKMQVAVRSVFGKNILAPIDRQLNGDSIHILDLGTGPGIQDSSDLLIYRKLGD